MRTRTRLRPRSVLAVPAMAGLVAGLLAGCSSSGKKAPDVPDKGVLVVTDNSAHPDQQVTLKDAEYAKVAGLADAAAAGKVNQALHAPLDWAVKWAGGTLTDDQKKECQGKSSIIQTKVRLGLRTDDLVSESNSIQMVPCYDGEGALPTVPVTVDVKAGKALTADDVFGSKGLEKDDLKKLWDALSGPKNDWKDCDLGELERKSFFPAKDKGDPMESPPSAGILFTDQGLEIIWSTTGTDCNNFTFTATYDKVKDLIDKNLYPRLLTAAGQK